MNNSKVLYPKDYISMPWRNGQGTTIELLKQALPNGQNDGFAWRLSMAAVVEDGAFSNFAQYDRTLVLLDGHGITLEHESGEKDILSKPLQSARFKGEVITHAILHNGPITDFNIMTRRNVCHAKTTCCIDAKELELLSCADTLLVFAVTDDVFIGTASGDDVTISCESLFVLESKKAQAFRISGAAFIMVEIFVENH